MSHLDFIMAYENGELDDDDVIVVGFQQLIDSGVVWQLQGHYGRTAHALIESGLCLVGQDNYNTGEDEQ